MQGTIAIQEKRSIVDKFKSWYKEKMIDTGTSARIEEGTVSAVDLAADAMKIYTVVAGVAVAIIPIAVSGGTAAAFSVPLGGLIATTGPMLMELCKNFGTKVYIKGKRATEALIIGEDGASKNVQIPNIDLAEEAKSIGKTIMTEAPDIIAKYEDYKVSKSTSTPGTAEPAAPDIEIPTEMSVDMDNNGPTMKM